MEEKDDDEKGVRGGGQENQKEDEEKEEEEFGERDKKKRKKKLLGVFEHLSPCHEEYKAFLHTLTNQILIKTTIWDIYFHSVQ